MTAVLYARSDEQLQQCEHEFDHDTQIRRVRCRKCNKEYRVFDYKSLYS